MNLQPLRKFNSRFYIICIFYLYFLGNLQRDNEKRIRMKRELELDAAAEERRILMYQIQKAKREEREEKEKVLEKEKRNALHLKMLAAQERASDKQAEIDAERAVREQEKYEEKELAKEAAKLARSEESRMEMLTGLKNQMVCIL
jgi:hypothetical protein